MSVAKVTEISASSPDSFEDAQVRTITPLVAFEDAIATGIDRANKTLDKVKGAWVSELKVDVDDGKVVAYRVNMKVTFVLKD